MLIWEGCLLVEREFQGGCRVRGKAKDGTLVLTRPWEWRGKHTYKRKGGKKAGSAGTAFGDPAFIIGIEFKDTVGEKGRMGRQNHRSVVRLLG